MTADASYPLDLDDRCGALWRDDLRQNPDTPDPRCDLNTGQDGPHHNTRHGITWGGPNDWGIHD